MLLRPDKQGQPRYASLELLPRLGHLARGGLRFAAHLCGEDCLRCRVWGPFFECRRAINGDVQRVRELHQLLGFRRMQLNPTKANEASGWVPEQAAENLRGIAKAMPELELILQVNEERVVVFLPFAHVFASFGL